MLNIKGLLLGNFRVFSGAPCFRLAPVTVLMGPNSSGKSTVTGSFSLIKNLNTGSLPYRLRLDSGRNPFGSFDMISARKTKEKTITAGYDIYNTILGENVRVEFTFEKGKNFDAIAKNISIRYKGGNLFDFSFEHNRVNTRIGLNYLYNKLKAVKAEKSRYLELENNFRQIRYSSGTYKDQQADDESQVKIFHVDNDLKRRNFSEYLKSRNITVEEYERLFYFYGKHRITPGSDGAEHELIRKAVKMLSDFSDDRILFNNDLLEKILEIPSETFDVQHLKSMISKDFPDLFDCLMLLNNPGSLNNIVDLLRSRTYGEWETEYLEYDITSSKRMKGCEPAGELSSAIDHNLQSRFDKSRFFRTLTELSMTREGFIQTYHRFKNIRALSSFCSLVLEKVIHDLRADLDGTITVNLNDMSPGTATEYNQSMHDLIRQYSLTKGKDTFVKDWLRKLKISDDFSIDASSREMEYFPGLIRKEEKNYLASEGSGTNRLLSMLLGIVNSKHYCEIRDYNDDLKSFPGTIILEQPETGLHPSWQSKLPEIFSDAYKRYGLHFIIETHSDYIINKLQYLVAAGKMNHNDIVIYYLDTSSGGSPKIIEITADKNGNLSHDIPEALLDEDDRRAAGLFRLRKVSRN
ncbi:MAG TPA: AAA family ATPase [Bacteroidales bacterium]|nr:AAA family ATPase [Bacteroidales bacterium]